MNATSRTLVFVGVAAVAAVAAMGVRFANRPAAVEGFSDVGQEFFADFKDPLKAMELSVVKYDADAKEPLSFSVKQNEKGLWVIPSHHDYPAEAAERLARTAASLIGIRKVALQSRSKDDWARYGVEDPSAEAASVAPASSEDKDATRGTRITLRDTSSNSLVDLIVGKAVEGREKHFYVRQPDKNPVFIARLDADLSAKFSDWIEPDLLKLNQNDVVRVVVDQYSIDEQQGAILQGDKFEFAKSATDNKWSMSGLDANVESLKETAVTDITRNLDQLKIVGVRPKPEGLNADLTVTREVAQNPLLQKALQADMQRQGFYIARGQDDEVKLVSNEGEVVAGTNNGVKYTLYFGEIARGTAKDIETGLNEPKAAEGEAAAEGDKAPEAATEEAPKLDGTESGPRRYLLVKVEFDESLLGDKPTEPVAPEKPAILNEGAAPATPDAKPADAPANEAPAADPAAPDATKSDAPAAETPAADAPKEEPAKEEPAPEAVPEKSADPGSCDEAATEPAASEAGVADEAKPAEPAQEAAAPAAEPVAQEPATAAPADEAKPADANAAAAAAPAQPPVDPKAEAQKQYDQAMGEYEAAKAGFEGALKAWEGRSKDGKKKAEELAQRFGSWYYVISADSFEKFKLTRETVVGPKEEEKPADPAAGPPGGSIPGFDLPGLGN